MPKFVVVYFDGGEMVNAGYADDLPPDGGIASAGIYETGRLADGYPAYLLVPDWKYEPETDELDISQIASRVAAGNKDFSDPRLQAAYDRALNNATSDNYIEYIQAYRKNTEEPSLDDFEQYLDAYEEFE
jgi:hypothetical protein